MAVRVAEKIEESVVKRLAPLVETDDIDRFLTIFPEVEKATFIPLSTELSLKDIEGAIYFYKPDLTEENIKDVLKKLGGDGTVVELDDLISLQKDYRLMVKKARTGEFGMHDRAFLFWRWYKLHKQREMGWFLKCFIALYVVDSWAKVFKDLLQLVSMEDLETRYRAALEYIDSLGIPREYMWQRLGEEIEPSERVRHVREGLDTEKLEELPYQDFVGVVHRSLDGYDRTPIDLGYDLLTEMARRLYESAPNVDPEKTTAFRLDFSNRKKLGRQLRNLREDLGIGLRELSRACSYSSGYLSEIEQEYPGRKFTPTLPTIYRYLLGLKRACEGKAVHNR